MNITAILNAQNPKITLDTLASIHHNMTAQVLVLIDGFTWHSFDSVELPAYKLKGFNHSTLKTSYRNIVLSLLTAYRNFPTTDWYCYLEHDCLISSPNFKKDLWKAEENNVWCLGADLKRDQQVDLSYLEIMLKEQLEEKIYLLGACVFLHKKFMEKISGFLEKFLHHTNEFKNGFFPFYSGWNLTEHLLPTMVNFYGGKLEELSKYNSEFYKWSGNYRKYPIRNSPDIEYDANLFLQASILHPVKDVDDPIRNYYRSKRAATTI